MDKKNKFLVMIVDDNPDLIFSVEEGLTTLSGDYEIIGAKSGKECLNLLKTKKPNVILLDIMMPKMDGWDLCAKIKSNKKTENIPIIFLTAKTGAISRGIGRLASSDYIEKPYDIKDLKKRLDKVLWKKRLNE